jgi:hypothetical protein
MYRPYVALIIILYLTGCASIAGDRLSETSSDPIDRAGQVTTDRLEQERQALFEQPYIDPLTEYLAEHNDDPARASVLQPIRKERDLRCETIARKYNNQPATAEVFQRYRSGYVYSCPEQVAAFEERVNRQPSVPEQKQEPKTARADVVEDVVVEDDGVTDQVLGDCYLLTSIRNYTSARKACHEPARNGDVRSQANMAVVAYAFEDYSSALDWAEKAAPTSGEAAFLLAQMYATGRGVGQNMDRAVYWYKEAASQGHKEAQAIIDRQRKGSSAGDT